MIFYKVSPVTFINIAEESVLLIDYFFQQIFNHKENNNAQGFTFISNQNSQSKNINGVTFFKIVITIRVLQTLAPVAIVTRYWSMSDVIVVNIITDTRRDAINCVSHRDAWEERFKIGAYVPNRRKLLLFFPVYCLML